MSDTLSVCGLTICRGSKLRTMLPVPGTEIEIPLTIINGASDGPTLLVTAGIHGGEYAMELGRSLDPQEIHGSLIMLHPVNIQGFWARREFIVPEDGKNLNRVFPGNPNGTLSEKTAGLISSSFFPLADFYVELHSGYSRKPAPICLLSRPADRGTGGKSPQRCQGIKRGIYGAFNGNGRRL